MSCNSCAKSFSLLRKEKGCPGCGFSYCSNCLTNKVFLSKLNTEAKVCLKCKTKNGTNESNSIQPPDAFFNESVAGRGISFHRRLESLKSRSDQNKQLVAENSNQDIADRLQKLKNDRLPEAGTSEDMIAKRLQQIKGETKHATEAELQDRLNKLKGIQINAGTSKTLPKPDLRSEQEQADDLIKQYLEQTNMEQNYKSEFEDEINSIESRLLNLKGISKSTATSEPNNGYDPKDDEDIVKQIIAKCKAEASLEDEEIKGSDNEELPFCEICNEDAQMRCLGCRYLFCKRCFLEHKDDDDGCNRYELYTPKSTKY